jgi:aryl-alcohol dehydrogenase-like predicted oxidoreductase
MKLALGTVQFGMPYGIKNEYGKIPLSQVSQILETAYNNKITVLDTAFYYGTSEEVLGNTLGVRNWKIVTKTPHFSGDEISDVEINQLVESFNTSLLRLGRERVYALMIHACDDLFKVGGERLFNAINNLKSSGLVDKIGVSVYKEEQVERLLNDFDIDIIQVPINVLDQRLLVGGYLERLKERKVEIHARSVFLQGLLLMPLKSIPLHFKPIIQKLRKFDRMALELSIDKLSLSLEFVNSIKEIDKIVVGVDSVLQLKQIIASVKATISPVEFHELIVSDLQFINPSLWKL